MQTVGKIVTGVAVTGALGSAGVGGFYAFFNSSSLSQQLISEGFKLVDSENEWTTIVGKYKLETTNTFTGSKDESLDGTKLRDKCQAILSQKSNDKNYKLARQWCVKEEAISVIIGRGYTILTTSEEKQEEKAIWTEKVEELKKSTDDKFKDLKDKMTNPNTDATTLRTECGKLKPADIKTTAATFGTIFEKTREFCSKKKD